jgi:hypothetical protein
VDLRGKRAGGGGEELQPHRPSTQRERERERESRAGWESHGEDNSRCLLIGLSDHKVR